MIFGVILVNGLIPNTNELMPNISSGPENNDF